MKSKIKPKICDICKKEIIIDENHLGVMRGPDEKGRYYHEPCYDSDSAVDISRTDLTIQDSNHDSL